MALKDYLSEALRHPIARANGRVLPASFNELREAVQREKATKAIAQIMRCDDVDSEKLGMAGADVCNNVIDSYDSRFAEASLRTVAKKLAGTGMSVGHDMAGWSYATMFSGRVATPESETRAAWNDQGGKRLREVRDLSQATWVKGEFYWPMEASWGPDLAIRISHAITREVSAHWAFELAVCSVCNDDMRNCDHFPGESYEGKKCWYEMREVTDYIETAFVIKGGQYGTSTYPISGRTGRSILPFHVALREVKSSKKSWGEWKQELRDVLGDRRPAGPARTVRIGAVDVPNISTPAELFASALKTGGRTQ